MAVINLKIIYTSSSISIPDTSEIRLAYFLDRLLYNPQGITGVTIPSDLGSDHCAKRWDPRSVESWFAPNIPDIHPWPNFGYHSPELS